MSDTLLIWIPHLLGLGFVFAFGACVGSFVNVVSMRGPEGMSVVSPPSRCSICGRRLAWHENLPVVGYCIALGRCWSCKVKIPVRYLALEVVVGLLFAAFYATVFVAETRGWWGRYGGSWYQAQGFIHSIPAFVAVVTLIAALVAATLTDLKNFTIPLSITLVPTVVGLGAWFAQGIVSAGADASNWPIPLAGWSICLAVTGAGCGVGISLVQLARGTIERSFSDYHEFLKPGETLAEYPHARREMVRELRFLAAPVGLGILGLLVGWQFGGSPPLWLQSLGGAAFGYFVGAGIMWVVRIIATSLKGIEAMGMGDVHLMGAAGATLGWIDPIVVFFLAPFSGLALVAVTGAIGLIRKGGVRKEIPYGPHLAAAIVVVILCRPIVLDGGRLLFPGLISAKSSLQGEVRQVK